jgi:hypothetical protein
MQHLRRLQTPYLYQDGLLYSHIGLRSVFVCRAAAGGCGRNWCGGSPPRKPYPLPPPYGRAARYPAAPEDPRPEGYGGWSVDGDGVIAGRAGGLLVGLGAGNRRQPPPERWLPPNPPPSAPPPAAEAQFRVEEATRSSGPRAGGGLGRGAVAADLHRACGWVAGPLVAGSFSHTQRWEPKVPNPIRAPGVGGGEGGSPPSGTAPSPLASALRSPAAGLCR